MTRVVFMGTPDFAVASLAALLSEGYEVAGVFTRQDQPAGRGQRIEESPIKRLARANGLPIYQPRILRDEQVQSVLAALSADLIVVAAYGLILPQNVLDVPVFGCLNVHGSLLPRHRGAAPVAAAILAGDPDAGVSIMRMDAGLDTGPVLSQSALAVASDDTTGSLTQRLSTLGAELLVETLPGWLAGQITPLPQEEEQASVAPRIPKAAGEIRWNEAAEIIERKTRGYQPWPSAYTSWKGQRLKVMRAQADVAAIPTGEPGQVIGDLQHAGVVTGQGVLWLQEVQLAGKRVLAVDVFLRGVAGFVGSRLPS